MKITNEMVAHQFNELADLLDIEGANPFRVRAYRNAARVIGSLRKNISDMVAEEKDLTELPGIGKDLAGKIKEIVQQGHLSLLKTTERKLPAILTQLMRLEGLGPKRVKMLHEELHVNNLDDLKRVIASKEIEKLRGFGKKLVAKINAAIGHAARYAKTTRLFDAWRVAQLIESHLNSSNDIHNVAIAGSFRRRKEIVGDLDVLVSAKNNINAIRHFLDFDQTAQILAQGKTRAAIRLISGMQVDLRVVHKNAFGAALLYFTGSKDHNVALRKIALSKKLKLNEYGLFRGTKSIAGRTEQEVYQALSMPYIEPELRENRGEIEAALQGIVPRLINAEDIRGDLHAHTKETDGVATLETMAKAARQLGYEYVAITDHSQHLAMTKGLDEKRLRSQLTKIDEINTTLKNFTILKSLEVDILENGQLDLPNSVLKELDLTVCSIHSLFKLSQTKQTERIIRAMDNPHFTILGHPTGRLINRRQPYEINLEAIMNAAHARGCFLELNAQPERLDLNDEYCRMAKDMGVKLAISTDAHSTTQFAYMRFGVFQARRGGLEKNDVINTRTLAAFRKLIKR